VTPFESTAVWGQSPEVTQPGTQCWVPSQIWPIGHWIVPPQVPFGMQAWLTVSQIIPAAQSVLSAHGP
jgi:hypothetical protein